MNPRTLLVGALVLLLAAAPALPETVLFLLACYGLGSVLGQILALGLGTRFPRAKEGRISAASGLVGLVVGLGLYIVAQR